MRPGSSGSTHVGIGLAVATLLLAACGNSDSPAFARPSTGAQQFWAVTLDHHAITMATAAPYDTFRITATPRDANGDPAIGLLNPVYTSSDVRHVRVDSTGLLHAIGTTTSPVQIVAAVTDSEGITAITLADTAYVTVPVSTATQVLDSLNFIARAASARTQTWTDSTCGVSSPEYLYVEAWDSSGVQIKNTAVWFESLDPDTATVNPTTGQVSGVYPGQVRLVTEATVFGVSRSDTLEPGGRPFIIGWPSSATMTIVTRTTLSGAITLEPADPTLNLSPGASVFWGNHSTTPYDIVFDDSTDVDSTASTCTAFYKTIAPWLCASGNIPAFALDSSKTSAAAIFLSAIATRSFPKVGTYTYHSTLFGTGGKVVIVDWHTL